MFNKFTGFLLIPLVLFSAETLKKDYCFEEPKVIDNVAYLKGCYSTREAFAPSIPVRPVKLLIPRGHEIVSFSVSYGKPVLMKGEYFLNPFRPSGRIAVGPPKDYYKKRSNEYSRDSFYPTAVRSENYYTQVKNGNTIFLARLNPVQYNAVTGKIKYYKTISVSVNTEAARTSLPKYHCTPSIKGYLKLLVDNHEAVDKLPLTEKNADSYEYLIVTSSSLMNSFDKFVEFNMRRCLRTKIESMQNIRARIKGRDDAEQLRNFIREEYEKYNIVYVLLGYDIEEVPFRGMRAECYDYGTTLYDSKQIAADMYFSCLDGTWQNSGSQYYGEFGCEDIGWEVYAARFSVGDETELNNMINKTIGYQENPVKDEVLNNLLLGQFLWGQPQHPVDCWGGDCMDQFMGSCNANFYTTTGFDDKWNTTKLYDKDDEWSKSDFLNAVKNTKAVWLDHFGHSNTYKVIETAREDVTNSNFTNDGTNANFLLINTGGCFPGKFSASDCIGEHFTSKISNCAFAFMGNSSYGFGDDGYDGSSGTDGSVTRIQRFFHDAIFGKKIHFLEMMNAYSKEVNANLICESDLKKPPYYGQMKYIAYEVNVLGDPALSLWTDTPKEWSDLPTASATGSEFNMETPPFTWVALLDENDSIITTQLTSFDTATCDTMFDPGDGHCKITDAVYTEYALAHLGESLKVRIKAHNYLSYEGTVVIEGTGITNNSNNKLLCANYFYSSRGIVKIGYTVPEEGLVKVSIYNSKGSLIKTIQKNQSIGTHSMSINNLTGGIYYCRIKIKNSTDVGKFVVTK